MGNSIIEYPCGAGCQPDEDLNPERYNAYITFTTSQIDCLHLWMADKFSPPLVPLPEGVTEDSVGDYFVYLDYSDF